MIDRLRAEYGAQRLLSFDRHNIRAMNGVHRRVLRAEHNILI